MSSPKRAFWVVIVATLAVGCLSILVTNALQVDPFTRGWIAGAISGTGNLLAARCLFHKPTGDSHES